MRRRLVALAAALLTGACRLPDPSLGATTDGTTPPRSTFRAMSCNLRYGTADDGPDAWPNRRELLARTIEAFAPDVLSVQEALDFQLDFLAARLPHHRLLGGGRDADGTGEHASLFVDERRFEVIRSLDFWLSPQPDSPGSVGWDAALPRICTFAQLRDRENGHALSVWSTHFDHRGEQARVESARLIAKSFGTSPGAHLLLGDLNCGESSEPLALLRAAGMRDTFRDLHPDATAVGTFHAFRGGTGGEKIDHLLVNRFITTRDAAIVVAPGPDGRFPSDHHFVTATLEF